MENEHDTLAASVPDASVTLSALPNADDGDSDSSRSVRVSLLQLSPADDG